MAFAQGQRLRGLDEAARAIRVFFEVHIVSLGPPSRLGSAEKTASMGLTNLQRTRKASTLAHVGIEP